MYERNEYLPLEIITAIEGFPISMTLWAKRTNHAYRVIMNWCKVAEKCILSRECPWTICVWAFKLPINGSERRRMRFIVGRIRCCVWGRIVWRAGGWAVTRLRISFHGGTRGVFLWGAQVNESEIVNVSQRATSIRAKMLTAWCWVLFLVLLNFLSIVAVEAADKRYTNLN